MSVELALNTVKNKRFIDLAPFQLFQVSGNHHIYVKLNNDYARTISQETSFEQEFNSDEQVVLLVPETGEEE